MTAAAYPRRVLAIDPTSRGFGFAVLEGPTTLIDWGVRSIRSTSVEKEIETVSKIADMIQHYRPHRLILEQYDCAESRRCGRVRLLLATIHNLTMWEGIKSRRISAGNVKRVFLAFGARTKQEIAEVVAQQLPELAPHLPKPRKPWMPEHYQMAIFDAAALALTYFYLLGSRRASRLSPR